MPARFTHSLPKVTSPFNVWSLVASETWPRPHVPHGHRAETFADAPVFRFDFDRNVQQHHVGDHASPELHRRAVLDLFLFRK